MKSATHLTSCVALHVATGKERFGFEIVGKWRRSMSAAGFCLSALHSSVDPRTDDILKTVPEAVFFMPRAFMATGCFRGKNLMPHGFVRNATRAPSTARDINYSTIGGFIIGCLMVKLV